MARGNSTARAGASFFIERDSLEYKQLQAFFSKESPSCEVVLACDPQQAALLATRRRGRAHVLLIQGGLADGRAAALLDRIERNAGQEPFEWVAYSDRRHFRGQLEEPALQSLEARLKPALADGWVLVRFLDVKART